MHVAGYEEHIRFYPEPSGIAAFKEELKPYKSAKGSVQFPLGRPLPTDLIRRMVVRTGLQDSIACSRRELTPATTTTLPSPPPPMCATDIAALRRVLHMSQAVFAATLNVSVKTIQSWEQGRRVPSDVALRFLQLVAEDPRVVDRLFQEESELGEARDRGAPRSSQHLP